MIANVEELEKIVRALNAYKFDDSLSELQTRILYIENYGFCVRTFAGDLDMKKILEEELKGFNYHYNPEDMVIVLDNDDEDLIEDYIDGCSKDIGTVINTMFDYYGDFVRPLMKATDMRPAEVDRKLEEIKDLIYAHLH